MSLTTDSPVHSSSTSASSDDFASFLDKELDSVSDVSPGEEEQEVEEEEEDNIVDISNLERYL